MILWSCRAGVVLSEDHCMVRGVGKARLLLAQSFQQIWLANLMFDY
jgi:hypothetical protein